MKKIKIKKISSKTNKSTKTKTEKKKFDFSFIKKYKITTILLGTALIGGIAAITGGMVLALYIIVTAPDFNKSLLYEKEATIIYDVNGEEMARTGKDNIELVTYDELPQVLVDAIVATEDSRFFQHTGLDAPRFLVASVNQVFGNSDAGGASTLSMQVIKNTYTGKEEGFFEDLIRKFTDVYMSIFKLENAYTKEEIIEFYVNSQWLAHDGNTNYTSITGVEQASQYFFGRSVSEISLAEASILAGMFQNPTTLNPYNYPENTRARQTTVLNLMVRHGYITEEQKENVLEIPIESLLVEREFDSTNYLQAAITYVIEEAEDLTGYDPYITPMKIYSTIDPEVQQVLNDVETGTSYEIPEARGNLQFGIAVTDMENGSITAMSAGIDYRPTGTNRATARRQPGSTAKPIFDYGPYIEYLNGSPGTLFIDEAHTYTSGGSVKNWDNKFKGIIDMREALIDSRNIPALKAFQEVNALDSSYIPDFVHGLGVDYGSDLYESASIGGFDGMSPLELSAAYAAFARDGYYIEPYSVTKAVIIDTEETYNHKYTKEKAMSTETAYLVTDMLVSAGDSYVGGFTVSGTDIGAKTGTTTIDSSAIKELGLPTSAIMDSWVATFNPQYSIATWIGYDSLASTLSETESAGYFTSSQASPIRNAISKAVGSKIYDKNLTFDMPSGIVSAVVEKDTLPLMLASENTPENMKSTELFKKGYAPTEVSPRYATLDNISNLTSTYDGTTIHLSWDQIKTPKAISDEYLTEYFSSTYFQPAEVQSKYYEQRLTYNAGNIGTVIYNIYLDTNGTKTFVGSTAGNTFSFIPTTLGETKLVVETSYTIFKDAASSGIETSITTQAVTPKPDPEDSTKPDDETNTEEP